MKKNIFSIILLLLLALNAFAYEINIFADNLEYDEHSSQLLAKGNVIFEWAGKKVFADYVEFDKKTVKAHSNVKIEESGNTIYADNVTYNYDEENGCIEETFGHHHSSNIFIRTKSMGIDNKDTYAISGIKLSKCDLDNPHIHIRAKYGKLILNKRLTIYNAVFYIGKIPVFYMPLFTKSLKSDKSFGSDLKFEINPKFTDNEKMYLNTVISCALSESLKGKVSADFFKKSGNSHEIKIDYKKQDATGSICANETNNLEKWTLTADYFDMIGSIWSIRSKVWVTNDKDIDNYKKNQWDNWDSFLSVNDFYPYFYSYVTVRRHGNNTNLNMSIARKAYDKFDKRKVSYILLPKIELTSYYRNIFMGIIHKFYFSYQNVYRQYQYKQRYYSDDYESYDNSFWKSDIYLNYKLMRIFKLGNPFTLVPALKIELAPSCKDDFGQKEDGGIVTKYSGSLNARFRVNDWMDWNIKYSLRAGLEKNSLYVETSSDDNGIEKNSVSFKNDMYLGKQTIVENAFSYNLQKHRLNYTQNSSWSPFTTKVTYMLNNYATVFAKQVQFLDPFRFGSLDLDLTIGQLDKAYLNFSAFYQEYQFDKIQDAFSKKYYKNHEISNTLGFGLCLTPKWRIDYNIKSKSSLDCLSDSKIVEQELKIYRDLHCYTFGIVLKQSIEDNNREICFKFGPKINTSSKEKKTTWWS
jgi:LPS-assembly protein